MFHFRAGLSFVTWVVAGSIACAAAPKNTQERRDDQRVNVARQDVTEAERKLAEESQDVREAAVSLAKASEAASREAKQVAETRAAVERRHEERTGLDRALAASAAARAEYDAAAKPILGTLYASPQYQAAKSAADAAQAKLLNGDPPDAAALREAVFVPSRLEREALAADSGVAKLRARLDERMQSITALRATVRESVESDSELIKSLGKLKAAQTEVDKAEGRLASERARALAAVVKLNQEKAQLQQALAQDKKNDDNNKKQPPPKKKQSKK